MTALAHTRSHILELLQLHRETMAQRFGVQEIALFGSAARDELRADSDVDVLVGFNGAASFDSYFGLKDYLEQLLGRPVDVVTQRGLKPRARQQLEPDLIRVT